jgi:hypothetical protein
MKTLTVDQLYSRKYIIKNNEQSHSNTIVNKHVYSEMCNKIRITVNDLVALLTFLQIYEKLANRRFGTHN